MVPACVLFGVLFHLTRSVPCHVCREVETSTLSSVSSLANLADDATALQAQLGSNPDVDSTSAAVTHNSHQLTRSQKV
jgi:hypothetical protein